MSENIVVDAQVGIKVSGYSNVHVNSNTVSTDPGIAPFGGGVMRGYDFANNTHLQAHYNTATNNSTNGTHQGFFHQLNSVTAMSCNEAELTGHGFMFDGLNAFTSFVGNSMQDAYSGLTLQNNGEIGDQPDQGAIPLGTNENEWDGSFGFAQTYTRNSTVGPNSWFYVSTASGTSFHPNQNLNDGTSFPIFFTQILNPDLQDCEPPNNLQLRMAKYEAIADGSYPTSPSNLLMYQYSLYHLLKMDSVSVDSSLIISAFYDSAEQATIGKFYKVDSLLDAEDFINAYTVNMPISSPHLIEQNIQLFNQIQLNYRLNQQTAYTIGQIDSLESLAYQCPSEGGPAVIRARIILENQLVLQYDSETSWYEFPQDCETPEERFAESPFKNAELGPYLQFFPNPTTGVFNVTYPVETENLSIDIVDLLGKKLRSLTLDKNASSMSYDLANLSRGTYLMIWKKGQQIVKTERLLITN